MEYGHRPSVEQQRGLNPIMKEVMKKEGGMTVVENEKNELITTHVVTGWRVCIDYIRLNKATCKDHFPLLFIDRTATFMRSVMAIFIDMVGKVVEAFMDDFSIFGFSYDDCLKNYANVFARCEEMNLVLNWENATSWLLEKDVTFNFDEACPKAFDELKKKLVVAPIIVAPDYSLPFELMCDASDHDIGVVLGQRKDKTFYSIYYTRLLVMHS
ncbi:uncharacterized protein LOC142171805 [Nicotiana tabacum]|uniref:Uncharacterized protein LOC142171805 n=1 Tax=Nicotiana tabacum TaxID=4097 RepID=A0AC58T319_TOBAC